MECINPFLVNYQKDNEMPVPCGKCPECLKRRVSHWSFRLMQQERVSCSSLFVTLTYESLSKNDNRKLSTISPNGFPTLCKRDLQLYFKRLRKLHKARTAIKYYAVGEYGTQKFRPHYHCIIFGAEPTLVTQAWSLKGRKLGHVHIGKVTAASVGYTLEYITEGQWKPRHKNDDRSPQFSIMSKGLGLCYINEAMIAWHRADLDNRMYCNLTDGKKIGMPRYYKQKLYTEDEKQRIGEISRAKMLREEAKRKARIGVDRYYKQKNAAAVASFHRQSKSLKSKL